MPHDLIGEAVLRFALNRAIATSATITPMPKVNAAVANVTNTANTIIASAPPLNAKAHFTFNPVVTSKRDACTRQPSKLLAGA